MYKDWFISGDQWEQENWAYKDGMMIHILHDNKCGTHEEVPHSIDEFLGMYGANHTVRIRKSLNLSGRRGNRYFRVANRNERRRLFSRVCAPPKFPFL